MPRAMSDNLRFGCTPWLRTISSRCGGDYIFKCASSLHIKFRNKCFQNNCSPKYPFLYRAKCQRNLGLLALFFAVKNRHNLGRDPL